MSVYCSVGLLHPLPSLCLEWSSLRDSHSKPHFIQSRSEAISSERFFLPTLSKIPPHTHTRPLHNVILLFLELIIAIRNRIFGLLFGLLSICYWKVNSVRAETMFCSISQEHSGTA